MNEIDILIKLQTIKKIKNNVIQLKHYSIRERKLSTGIEEIDTFIVLELY